MPDTPWRAGTLARGGGSPRVLFGWSYEDEQVELAAFGVPGRVLVIAASGETAVACAAAGHHVVAVDINPVQLAYARSRVAGGPVVMGAAERGMASGRAALRAVAPAWRRDRLRTEVFDRDGVGPATYWSEHLDGRALQLLLGAALRPGVKLAGLLRPEFAGFVPERFDTTLRARIGHGLATYGARGNRFAWRLLAGQELPGWTVPPAVPGSISWVQGDVVEELERQPAGSFTGIALSNVTDGASAAFAARLRAAAFRALAPTGALVTRSFLGGPASGDAALLWGTVRVERRSGLIDLDSRPHRPDR